MMSQSINELATALSKAQSEIKGAKKDQLNPFFKSKYADLASTWEACRVPLTKNGLSVAQTTDVTEKGLIVITTLMHSSGQFISGIIPILTKDNGPQAMGSALSYSRRYALAAIVGVSPEDDDAEISEKRKPSDRFKTETVLLNKPDTSKSEHKEAIHTVVALGNTKYDLEGEFKNKTFKEIAFNEKGRVKDFISWIKQEEKQSGALHPTHKKFIEYISMVSRNQL